MSSIYTDIRSALENRLNDIVGIPEILWENTTRNPDTTSSYVMPMLISSRREPAVRGTNPQQLYTGVYRITCGVPVGTGPSAADDLADTIINNFEATTDLTYNGKTISIRRTERSAGVKEDAHYEVTVFVFWYIYD